MHRDLRSGKRIGIDEPQVIQVMPISVVTLLSACDVVILLFNQVCGCDDMTYGNECLAHGRGVSVSRVGECDVVSDSGGGTCTTQDQCDIKRLELGIETFVPGTFPTKGCFSKTGVYGLVAYWSEGGTAEEMSSTDLPGVQERITCEEDDVPVDTDGGICTAEDQCDMKRLELGIETFVPGTFPTKGCFSKTGVNGVVAYWSEGGTAEEISSTDLPGVQERITCEGVGSTSAGGTECESGPMADPAKSCDSGQFCQLDVGVCNTKNGVFTGACEIKPEACIEIYDPVRELELTSRK